MRETTVDEAEVRTLEALCQHGASFCVFGRRFTFRTNEERALRLFLDDYGRFACPAGWESGEGHSILVVWKPPQRHPVLVCDRRRYDFQHFDVRPNVHSFVLNFLIREVADYFLIHSGVLARHGCGVVIAAPSTFGKTTLTLELVLRGFEFLSDEVAAVRRQTGLIEPFPRGFGVRRSTMRMYPCLSLVLERGRRTRGHIPLDIERHLGGRIGSPSPLRYVFFLTRQPTDGAEPRMSDLVEVALTHISDELIADLRASPGVRHVEPMEDRALPTLRVALEGGARIVERLDGLLARHQAYLVFVNRGSIEPPDFAVEPRLTPMKTFEGYRCLINQLLNASAESSLYAAMRHSYSRLLFELASLSPQARFFELSVGNRRRMADLVEAVVT